MSAENKTVQTAASVDEFIATVDDERQRDDSRILVALMHDVTREPARMWGPSIVGFGSYHYRYESGREGDAPMVGFAPRKGKLAIYLLDGLDSHADELAALGRYTHGKGCLWIKRLSEVDLDVLKSMIASSYRATAE